MMNMVWKALLCVGLFTNVCISEADDSEVKVESNWVPPKCVRKAQSGDFVRYHYYANFLDGTYLDSSYERGRTYNTYVDSGWLIKGMDIALKGMCINEKKLVTIPPNLAYGIQGTEDVPSNSTLMFDILLLDVWNEKDTFKVTSTYVPKDCNRKLEESDYIRYHYNGTLLNGMLFHSSYEEDSTYNTYVGKGYLIEGMDEGLIGSCVGERRTIVIPPKLAYGEKGDGKNIPASATVVFDVEVSDFHNPKDSATYEILKSKYLSDDSKDNCPRRVENGDFIRYHYNGTLMDGTVFDTSYQRNHTYDTYVGRRRIIAGMEQGILGTCVGERRKIIIPPHLGYGEEGVGDKIPGSAVIIFYIELIDVHNPDDDVKIEILVPPVDNCKRKAKAGDYVTYSYTITLMDETLLGESDRYSTYIGQKKLIVGLERTVEGMCVGEKRKAVIPPHLAYGEQGQGAIPSSAVLIFTVTMESIELSMPPNTGFLWLDGQNLTQVGIGDIDDDNDGKISLSELASYAINEVTSGKARFQPDITPEEAVEVLFKRLDKNGDGFVSKDEFDLSNPPKTVHSDEL